MPYVPHSDGERDAMLAAIGVERLEDLFADVPASHRFPDLDLPPPVSELETEREMSELAGANFDVRTRPCFLGAGTYRHYIPATVDDVLRRGELYTAYTPYQPEMSQGVLQATFEYQSMICELTGMDVANASHYDGATALAEAVLLALAVGRGRRKRVVVSPGVHPRYREVLATYLQGTDATTVGGDRLGAGTADLVSLVDDETAALVVQSPDFFGQFERVDELAAAAHERGALCIAIPDPIALGWFRSPGEDGADVIAADGQSLGIPMSYGGPHLGIFATREAHLRRTVGRLVGETVDAEDQRGYVLTLGTREQHIRRERATSNICTNAALGALAATVYLTTLGKHGLRRVAELCFHKSHYAAERLAGVAGIRVNPQAPEKPFFKEFVVELPVPASAANRFLRDEHGILGGYDLASDFPDLDRHMLIAVTETVSRADIDKLVSALEELVEGPGR